VVVAILLAVGVAGTAIALQSREGNTQFVAQQQGQPAVGATSVEQLLQTTSDPRPGRGGRVRLARCKALRAGVAADGWSCLVRYPRPPRMSYRVVVRGDRSIRGVGRSVGVSGEAADGQRLLRRGAVGGAGVGLGRAARGGC
jgi:hypothetical protein